MEIEVKTDSIESEKPIDMASKMMEKIVMFLNKYGAKPETVKEIIAQVTPKIEEMAKTEEKSSEDEVKSAEDEKKPTDNWEDTYWVKNEDKPMNLQDRLNAMCKNI